MIGDVPLAWVLAGALGLIGGICHMAAWLELREWNHFDIAMRGLPFEDLTPRGQALRILSWLFAVAAVVVILMDRLPAMRP